jgi:ubiquinone/menaquinone biosynthesis C-methylase UbiE
MTQLQDTQSVAVTRAKAFDWWFSKFGGLYNLLLVAAWGRRHRKALPHIQGPRVLEVSFGMGYLLSQYADRYDVTGIDYNPRYVEAAKQRLQSRQLRANLLEGDAHALPFPDGSFNTLINTDAFTLYQDPQKAMSEFYRVLAPGGRLILMEYNYPKDGNWLGRFKVEWARWAKVPYLDFDALLKSVGFEFEDHDLGNSGILHMYIATKPLTASGTSEAPAQT